jgi:hypothetical protein
LAHDLGLVVGKAVHGQLAADVPGADIVRQVALFGAHNRDGWRVGLTILTALANLLLFLPEEEAYPALYHEARRVAADCDGEAPRSAFGTRRFGFHVRIGECFRCCHMTRRIAVQSLTFVLVMECFREIRGGYEKLSASTRRKSVAQLCFAKRPDFLRAGIGPNVQSVYAEA